MASVGSKECLAEEAEDSVKPESASFQKNLFDLFEKNGILNDLRAYLRCQIVDVLKSAQTGGLPACQRHFTQRLELHSQALNILLAEYFLKYEFSYTLSVFISEIPLANMVFGFAKTLLKNDKQEELKFEDGDVWTILNYLGIQCDSEHAASVLEMYKNEEHCPLLLCIMKAMPMYNPLCKQHSNSSEETLLTPRDSAATLQNNISPTQDTCKHFVVCKPCQNRVIQVKEKYRSKKRTLAKHTKDCDMKTQVVENVMKNITVIERNIMDEMFQHVKSVYEGEMAMMKVEEANKVKRSVASCQMYIQKKCDELERSYRAREAELESNIQEKKKFLWGLARALREQHNTLNCAMLRVKLETGRLTAKEDSLKSQVAEAETVIQQKSEAMRSQISDELAILSTQLETMKYERDTLNRERNELEKSKETPDAVQSQYDSVRKELALLRSYVESFRMNNENLVDAGTNTCVLNNTQERLSKLDDFENRLKANQLVNDFRKKNVNFDQETIDIDGLFPEHREQRSRSSGSSEGGDTLQIQFDREHTLHIIRGLRDENQRLKRQQTDYAERLERRAPPVASPILTHPVSTAASAGAVSGGWSRGAGEQPRLAGEPPRLLCPGDTLPFIGVLRDRHPARRQLVTQWRSVRARSPVVGVSKRTMSPLRDRIVSTSLSRHSSSKLQAREMTSLAEEQPDISSSCRDKQTMRAKMSAMNKHREKSPKSVLREAKEKLRNNNDIKDTPPPREKSPTTVLRDAKLRLRKLEIEAEAVEKSYRNFKQRQSELKFEGTDLDKNIVRFDTWNSALHINRNIQQVNSQSMPTTARIDIPRTMTQEYETFISNFKKLNVTNHLNQNLQKTSQSYLHQENFLEKPLNEFRKFYRPQEEGESVPSIVECDGNTSGDEIPTPPMSSRKDALKKVKNDKKAEFEILKQNINKMYNIPDNIQPDFNEEPMKDATYSNNLHNEVPDTNVLHIEVESASEIHDVAPSNELLLVVSSVENPQVTVSGSSGSSHKARKDIYGPKLIEDGDKSPERLQRSESPEKAANLTKNDVLDAIFQAEPGNNESSVRMTPSKASSINEYEKDYPDDFSADVDNYGRSDDGSISPISQAKNYDEDNFWESSM